MLGRIKHYYRRFSQIGESLGYFGAAQEMVGFLWRRKFFLQFLFEWVEYQLISRGRDLGKTVVSLLKDEAVHSSKLLLYASFDASSSILPHVVQQLQFFKEQGYDIVWVSTSPQVSLSEFQKIADLVQIGIHRRNEGYDFGSWKVGFDRVSKLNLSSLIIMNDSCLGPKYDFSQQLAKIESAVGNAYGMTKSYEIAEYLQSYFIHFGANLIRDQSVAAYFSRIRWLNSKWGIVRFLEIGGSRFLVRKGIQLLALADAADEKLTACTTGLPISDLVLDPVGSKLVEMKIIPFYKRSNLNRSNT